MIRLLTTLTVASILIFSAASVAAPITSFTAQGNYSNSGAAISTSTPTFDTMTVGSQVPSSATNILGSTTSNVSIQLTSVSGGVANATFSSNGPGGVFTVDTPLGQAQFTFIGTASGVPLSGAQLVYLSLAPSGQNPADPVFGLVGQQFSFTLGLSGVSFSDGTPGTLNIPGNSTYGATVTLNSNGLSNIFGVPEPATLAICGIFGVAGLIGARRKLKKSAEPTVAA